MVFALHLQLGLMITERKEKKRKEKDSQLQRGLRCSERIPSSIAGSTYTLTLAEPVCYSDTLLVCIFRRGSFRLEEEEEEGELRYQSVNS